MKNKNLPPSPSMGVDTKPAHRLEIDGYWILVDPAMPKPLFEIAKSMLENKLSRTYLSDPKPKTPDPIIIDINHVREILEAGCDGSCFYECTKAGQQYPQCCKEKEAKA